MHELVCVFLSIFRYFYPIQFFFEDDKINLFLFVAYSTFHKHLEVSQVLE